MKKLIFAMARSVFAAFHSSEITDTHIQAAAAQSPLVSSPPAAPTPAQTVVPEESTPYPGRLIHQEFPIIEDRSFTDPEYKEKAFSEKAGRFDVDIKNFAPRTISRKGHVFCKYKTRTPDDYSSSLVGFSHLLGKRSTEIYTVAVGPGGVCCTNYWIMDVSSGKPRNIFRSEDFGAFRDPIEVFDADGEGIYELVQSDSAFRYFMDDCGACSPELRAVFKYYRRSGRYVPARGLQQNFVKKAFGDREKWLAETFKTLEKGKDPRADDDFYKSALVYVVELFYLGETSKAWAAFEKYYSESSYKQKVRTEIKDRLKHSRFFQALQRSR